jgi:hypothetical protein
MHSDSTLVLLDELTTEFGKLIRQFRDLSCTQFKTVELPRETAARKRKRTRKQAGVTHNVPQPGQPASNLTANGSNPSETVSGTTTESATLGSEPQAQKKSGTRAKVLNLFTVKLHFLGDYVRHIRLFGTTDSYSTQLVRELTLSIQLDPLMVLLQGELAHRLVKRLYGLTNKKDAIRQIGKKYSRQEAFRVAEKQEEKEADQPHQETATLLWLSLDALAVLEHPEASWDVLGGLRMS